ELLEANDPQRFQLDASALALPGDILSNGRTELYAASGTGGVYTSTDDGARWSAVNLGLDSLAITALAVTSRGMYAGTRQGEVFVRIGDPSWSFQSSTLAPHAIKAFLVDAIHSGLLVAGTE